MILVPDSEQPKGALRHLFPTMAQGFMDMVAETKWYPGKKKPVLVITVEQEGKYLIVPQSEQAAQVIIGMCTRAEGVSQERFDIPVSKLHYLECDECPIVTMERPRTITYDLLKGIKVAS
jgi:hypothetical protein